MRYPFRIAVLMCVIVTAGCAVTQPHTSVTYINVKQLNHLIKASEVRTAASETGTLRAWLDIENLSKARVTIEARATFKGEQGRPIESPTGWQTVFVERDSSVSVQFLSMSTAAKQVVVELREAAQ